MNVTIQDKEGQIIALREDAKRQLAEIKTIDDGVGYVSKVKAIEAYAKATKQDADIVMMVQEQKIRSMRILGQLLRETEFEAGARGRPGNQYSLVESHDETPPKPTLSDFGITKNESSTYQTIAEIPEEELEKQFEQIKGKDSAVSEITINRFKNLGKGFKQERKVVETTKSNPWPKDQEAMKRDVEAGKTVVINMNQHLHLLRWATDQGLYERVDRFTEWGNPFELGKDGSRDEVCDAYSLHYFPFKKSLHNKVLSLKGKVLGCHCHPKRCHGHFLSELLNKKPQ